jgi:hypothetical protein
MMLHRSTRLLAPVLVVTAALLTAGTASIAHAAPVDRQLFTWTGRVDREVYITMRGRDVRTRGIDAELPNRARVNDALPRALGDVQVQLLDGRGTAQVIEQPSARNGYTTTIRVIDPRGGADSYRVAVYWIGDDWYDRDRTRDRDRDRDRDSRRECGPDNMGRGGGWGRGGRDTDCAYRPGRGNGNAGRDRNDRGGSDERVLRWSGRVDDVVELRLAGRRVEAITRSGRRVEDVNSAVRGSGLPARDLTLTIDRHSGRGNVQVVQQPSAWNNYTAVIRIYDPQGGSSYYDFSAYWH